MRRFKFSSPDIGIIKARRKKWAGHVARIGAE
jgi:hypothetical protein